jgi:hypothetical protein
MGAQSDKESPSAFRSRPKHLFGDVLGGGWWQLLLCAQSLGDPLKILKKKDAEIRKLGCWQSAWCRDYVLRRVCRYKSTTNRKSSSRGVISEFSRWLASRSDDPSTWAMDNLGAALHRQQRRPTNNKTVRPLRE